IWIWITLLPTLILNSESKDKPLTKRDYIGWSMFVIGFFLEAVADHQKSVFRANPENADTWINTGLWSISRHPNYFGEILLWFGLYVSASSVYNHNYQYLTIVSPLFVTYLLTQVSGVPLLEKIGQHRWGQNAQYQRYVKNTAVLIPFIW
ncbi:uncharacterized protein LOC102808528, partial [Saccoglossus kowalevskii]|uniref:Uncharacterized protein LOC102808528 n=1 Tax=Saccoglossus kowalevskii TaxID=10224 RepID=A0ABM0MB87_SACKO